MKTGCLTPLASLAGSTENMALKKASWLGGRVDWNSGRMTSRAGSVPLVRSPLIMAR